MYREYTGRDKILAACQLARLVAGLARLDSVRFNFFTCWIESLARYFNEPAHELKRAEAYHPTTINPEDDDVDLEVYTYSIGM